MPIAKHLTLETVDFEDRAEVNAFLDQVMDEGMRRVKAEGAELRARGVINRDSIHQDAYTMR